VAHGFGQPRWWRIDDNFLQGGNALTGTAPGGVFNGMNTGPDHFCGGGSTNRCHEQYLAIADKTGAVSVLVVTRIRAVGIARSDQAQFVGTDLVDQEPRA